MAIEESGVLSRRERPRKGEIRKSQRAITTFARQVYYRELTVPGASEMVKANEVLGLEVFQLHCV